MHEGCTSISTSDNSLLKYKTYINHSRQTEDLLLKEKRNTHYRNMQTVFYKMLIKRIALRISNSPRQYRECGIHCCDEGWVGEAATSLFESIAPFHPPSFTFRLNYPPSTRFSNSWWIVIFVPIVHRVKKSGFGRYVW